MRQLSLYSDLIMKPCTCVSNYLTTGSGVAAVIPSCTNLLGLPTVIMLDDVRFWTPHPSPTFTLSPTLALTPILATHRAGGVHEALQCWELQRVAQRSFLELGQTLDPCRLRLTYKEKNTLYGFLVDMCCMSTTPVLGLCAPLQTPAQLAVRDIDNVQQVLAWLVNGAPLTASDPVNRCRISSRTTTLRLPCCALAD